LLEPHLRNDIEVVRFGARGDVAFQSVDSTHLEVAAGDEVYALEFPFTQEHLRTDLLAAVAAARATGVTPDGRVEVALSAARGQRLELPGRVTLIDDCYNANPMSMRAALDDLAQTAGEARTVAVLGDMLELGQDEREFHRQIGEHADTLDVDVLVTVGPLAVAIGERFEGEVYPVADAGEAAALVPELLAPGDVVLVKGSRGVGLELVTEALAATEDQWA
jgi:UDP-N-acetylmuramoyl-tripeptide--D-alanyl-D-alanine ligase